MFNGARRRSQSEVLSKMSGLKLRLVDHEFQLSKAMMLEISDYTELMEEEQISKASINVREEIVLPLLTIQQYGLQKVAEHNEFQKLYEKIITRSLYGNINASRNSA